MRPTMNPCRWLAVALLSFALTACPGGGNGDGGVDAGPECTERSQCPTGQVCTAGGFCAPCESSGQCSLREVCNPETFACELRAGYGAECTTNDVCSAGQWCMQGLCKDRSEVSLCPSGASEECPQGQRCNAVNTVCEEDLGCADDFDCGAGEVCNVGSHACVPRCTVDTQAFVCAANEKCVDERCVQCAASADCSVGLTCDAAGRCVSGARCYTDRDCKVPRVCHVPTGACLDKLPPCVSDESCLENQRCDVSSGRCVPRDCQPDRYEPNNEATAAFGIAASRYDDLTLCDGDVDWYSVSLSRGDELGVNLDADPFSENAFSTVIKDGTGRTLASGKLLVSHVASAAQTYYVAISSVDLFQTYDVTFLLTRGTPCDDDGWEPNDSVMQATALNNATSIDGAICPQDVDHFRMNVPDGKGVTLSLSGYNSAAGLLRLCLLEGEVALACSEEAEPVVTVAADTAGGKVLTARVVGSTDRIANAYTLEVEFP